MTHEQQTQAHPCQLPECDNTVEATATCEQCAQRLTNALAGGLARLYVELHLSIVPGRTGNDDPRTSSSKKKRLPINTDCVDAQTIILHAVTEWENALRQEMGWINAPRRGRPGPTLTGACHVLLSHLPEALTIGEAPAHAQRVLYARRTGRAALEPDRDRFNRLPLPCPSCQVHSLRRRNGTDEITCAVCQHAISADLYDTLLDPIVTEEAA